MQPLVVLALLGLSCAIPTPQLIDTAGVEAAPDPVFVTPSYNVLEEAGAANEPAIAPRARLQRRDGTCAPQPAGSGPVSSPDTPEAFLSNPVYPAMANNAPTPDGYTMVMQNGDASLSASNYMGLRTLKSYDTLGCASLCDQATGCQAFNMYVERDPTLDPNAVNCPNPPSLTNYKCTLWGAVVSAEQAKNKGQWRDSFQVVIAASNAYNNISPPSAISCYTGPEKLGGAINAPLDAQGKNTYMGYKYHPFSQTQGYDPSTCAADCNSQTAYNKRHPAADGSYQTCIFFNAYVLSMNGVPQGLYCSMYTQVWAAKYATNYGQYRGTDRYTVSRSFSYSLDATSDGSGSCGTKVPSQSSTSQSSTSQSSTSQSSTSSSAATPSSSAEVETTSTSVENSMTSTVDSQPTTSESTTSTTAIPEPTTTLESTTTPESTATLEATTTPEPTTIPEVTTALEPSTTPEPTSTAEPTTTPESTTTSPSSSAFSTMSPSTTSLSASGTTTTSSSSTTSAASTPLASFCLQNPSTGQFASLSKGGNGLEYDLTTAKNLPSLFTLDSAHILTSVKTGLIAVLNLPTFGTDGSAEGHIEGTTLDMTTRNTNYKPLECDIASGNLMCRSAANYIDPRKTPALRSQLDTTTKGNDGVDRFVFAPTKVVGAVAMKVFPASACGPNYS
ncbi:MAG: hypothetical protein Q9216_004445 [Gyalolechia sp. 2 TL-2023]